MSILTLFMSMLLFISTHACNARHTFDFLPNVKVIENAMPHEVQIKGFPGFNTKEISLGGKPTSMALDEDHKVEEITENSKEEKARSMLESSSKENKKKPKTQVDTNEEDEPVDDDPVGMDYVQVHHATPIHNQH